MFLETVKILFKNFRKYLKQTIFKFSKEKNMSYPPDSIVKFDSLDPQIQNILREALQVRNCSYSPYSEFKVGASLLSEDNVSYKGCNVENVSFTVGVCAERAAYCKAISEGKRKFKAIAIIAYQKDYFTTPCGACRQFISEFGNLDIYISKPDLRDVFVTSSKELLPYQFSELS